MAKKPSQPVKTAFEDRAEKIAISDIIPLRLIPDRTKKSTNYAKIAASIREIGIVEPPVVARDRSHTGKYLLLDGHLRIEVLKGIGAMQVTCLIATDDEAFTYNKRVNRLATIQEHKMILKAIERGVPEERIARALNIDVKTLEDRKYLLHDICPEVAELLKDKHVPIETFRILKKMRPLRQIEAAELMVGMNTYTTSYAKSLFAATPQDQLVDSQKPKSLKGLSPDQISLIERESANLERQFKMVERSYGSDHLDLVLAKGFLAKLLRNAQIVRYLAQHHAGILAEFQKVADMESAAAA
jgi:RepB plasmid partitioning protein/ParB-like nuclease family protein